MDSGRVGACHRLENKRRKYLMVINDVIKNRYDVVAEYLDHAHDESANNFEKSKAFVRRALVRQKVLQKCMRMRRHNPESRSDIFGRYGGKPIDSFGRDIENYIQFNHPKKRRKRYLQTLMNESLEKGVILKENIAKERVQSWMERSYTRYKLMKAKREKSTLKPIQEAQPKVVPKRQGPQLRLPAVMRNSYAVTTEPETQISLDRSIGKITEEIENLDLDKTKNLDLDKTHEAEVSEPDPPEVTDSRPTLKLPPINPTRSMVAT